MEMRLNFSSKFTILTYRLPLKISVVEWKLHTYSDIEELTNYGTEKIQTLVSFYSFVQMIQVDIRM